MDWYVNYGNPYTGDGKTLTTSMCHDEKLQPGASYGPFPSEFKARGFVEQRFGGIGNVQYNPDKRGGILIDYPYHRSFEIFGVENE